MLRDSLPAGDPLPWTHRVRSVRRGATLRVRAAAPFRLHWTANEWSAVQDIPSTPTALGIEYVDVPIGRLQAAPIRFTFFRPVTNRWERHDFQIDVRGIT